MKIRALRDYSGDEGTDADKNVPAGSEHIVTRARGSALFANGLVEILDDEAEPEEIVVKEQDRPTKAITTPENKRAPEPANKAAGKPAAKSVPGV